MTQRATLRHYIEAVPLWLVPAMLRPLPFGLRVRIGGAMIAGLIRLVPGLRKRIWDNLNLIYPQMTTAERKALFNRIRRNIGWGYIEILFGRTMARRLSQFHVQSDIAALQAAVAAGQPILIVSGHFGNWDAIRAALSAQIGPVGALFKRPANPLLGRNYDIAAGAGLPMFEATPRGMAEMVRHLKAGGIASILNDQRPDEGVWLDFMGQPALTALSAARLALRCNALLVPCYAVRRGDVHGFDVFVEPPIAHGDPEVMTQALNDSLAARVRAHPEQWYWLHRRWAGGPVQAIDKKQL